MRSRTHLPRLTGELSSGRAKVASIVIDEMMTPDSSRYWPADAYREGVVQSSFDKQFVRNWLTGPESGWDRHAGTSPPPLPDGILGDRVLRENPEAAYAYGALKSELAIEFAKQDSAQAQRMPLPIRKYITD